MPEGAMVREMEPEELHARLAAGDALELVDVREPWEWQIARIEGARLIPLGTFAEEGTRLDRERDVVLYCHHGVRSLGAANWLVRQGFTRVWNLAGGIERYAEDADPAIPRY